MVKEKEKQHLKIYGYETQKRTKILRDTTSSSTIKAEKQNTLKYLDFIIFTEKSHDIEIFKHPHKTKIIRKYLIELSENKIQHISTERRSP